MSNLLRGYDKTRPLLHELESDDNYLNQVRVPKLNYKQLFALNLAAEALWVSSERYKFKQHPDQHNGLSNALFRTEGGVK